MMQQCEGSAEESSLSSLEDVGEGLVESHTVPPPTPESILVGTVEVPLAPTSIVIGDMIVPLGAVSNGYRSEVASSSATGSGETELPLSIPTSPALRMRRRHRSQPFIIGMVHRTKNHFGGLPDGTKSNVMAVSRFIYDQCLEHNCLPHQIRHILAVAVPLVLSPDHYDVESLRLLNGAKLCEMRAVHKSAKSINGWLQNLVCHPLDSRSWRRALDNLMGLPDWQAFQLVK